MLLSYNASYFHYGIIPYNANRNHDVNYIFHAQNTVNTDLCPLKFKMILS